MSYQVVVDTGVASESVDLADGDRVVIGREPQAIPGESRALTVALPSVSANHLALRRSGDVVELVDTNSRNGTWLRLPPGDPVEVRSSKTLQVTLATPKATMNGASGPKDATWLHRGDFHQGVIAAVRAWFETLDLPVRVSASPSPRDAVRDQRMAGKLPLANGYQLEVVPTRTVDASWGGSLELLWRYVNAQNAIFTSEEESRDEGMILASEGIRRAHQQVVSAAQRGHRLLLIGPSGSGKDGLARSYHRHSRRSGAFIAKNCSMLGRELLRAELFGAEQGAFTGAVRRIVGAVEACHGGTLFLDEIGEMTTEVQPYLLTFLDRGEYERIGSYDTLHSSDTRIVCATNKDLRAATLRGEFRDDLWYRLAEQVVHVPPLCDRPEDIAEYLRGHVLDSRIDAWTALDEHARVLVLGHAWHGNFRELATFALHFPRDATAGSVGAKTIRAMLDEISLAPRMTNLPSRPRGRTDLSRLATVAAESFAEDAGHELRSWDDVKDCFERYLKPLVFAELSGAAELERREAASIPELAAAVDADRGTVLKQLTRYFERFKK